MQLHHMGIVYVIFFYIYHPKDPAIQICIKHKSRTRLRAKFSSSFCLYTKTSTPVLETTYPINPDTINMNKFQIKTKWVWAKTTEKRSSWDQKAIVLKFEFREYGSVPVLCTLNLSLICLDLPCVPSFRNRLSCKSTYRF